MVKVQRANVVLTVEDDDAQRYLDMGYNVLDESGNIAKKAIPTDIGALRYAYVEMEATIDSLTAEVKLLKDKLKKAEKSAKKAEKAVETTA